MRLDEMLNQREKLAEKRGPVEYPKYIDVNGESVLALNEEHEAELLGRSDEHETDPASEQDAGSVNLLSDPPKRRGRPPKSAIVEPPSED